jgi:tRNA/rRNA methyltransferase
MSHAQENTPSPAIILVKPQLGENIGMVARAMLNCGLTDLRLVAPRDGWPNPAADAASSGALSKGVEVRVFETTQCALEGCALTLATTARPRDMIKHVYTPKAAITLARQEAAEKQSKVAILFGGERAGLENDDIALSDAIITAPLNPGFTSLNLAQAVLLIAYEWISQNDAQTPPMQFHIGETHIADKETSDHLIQRMIELLDERYFFRSPDMRPSIERSIINLMTRMQWTAQDINTFHGILSALIGLKEPLSKHQKDNKGDS